MVTDQPTFTKWKLFSTFDLSLYKLSLYLSILDKDAIGTEGYLKDQEQGSQGRTESETEERTETSKAKEAYRKERSRS